jgi:hypothetical protein
LVELEGGEVIIQDPVFEVEEEHWLLCTRVRFQALIVEGTPCGWGLPFSSLVSSHEGTRWVCETIDHSAIALLTTREDDLALGQVRRDLECGVGNAPDPAVRRSGQFPFDYCGLLSFTSCAVCAVASSITSILFAIGGDHYRECASRIKQPDDRCMG